MNPGLITCPVCGRPVAPRTVDIRVRPDAPTTGRVQILRRHQRPSAPDNARSCPGSGMRA